MVWVVFSRTYSVLNKRKPEEVCKMCNDEHVYVEALFTKEDDARSYCAFMNKDQDCATLGWTDYTTEEMPLDEKSNFEYVERGKKHRKEINRA